MADIIKALFPDKKVPAGTENHYWVTSTRFMHEHFEVPIFFSIVYLAVVFLGPKFMEKRDKYNVKWIAVFWNGALAIFSILGAYFYAYTLVWPGIQQFGLSYELCSLDTEYASPWVFLFCLSKIPELFDTAIHVLKKQQTIFLHWYHHVTVMWFCWFAWAFAIENGGVFAGMNLMVHSVMYTYYTLGALGVRFPNPIRVFITLLQIVQMVLGLAIVSHNIINCNHNPNIQLAGLFMYLSYGVLFVQFFIKSYCGKKDASKEKKH